MPRPLRDPAYNHPTLAHALLRPLPPVQRTLTETRQSTQSETISPATYRVYLREKGYLGDFDYAEISLGSPTVTLHKNSLLQKIGGLVYTVTVHEDAKSWASQVLSIASPKRWISHPPAPGSGL